MRIRRFVDLSISIEPDLPSDPQHMIPRIEYAGHEQGAKGMIDFFPGLKKEQLPGGLGWAVENLALTSHSGTHLDAPYHYHPTMDQGKPALRIDEIPLEWCFSDGVVLDFRHKADGERISVKDIERELEPDPVCSQALRYRPGPNRGRRRLGNPAIPGQGCGNGPGKHPLSNRQGCEDRRDRRMELGSPSSFTGKGIQRERGSESDLGSSFCRNRKMLLPHGEDGESILDRQTARFYRLLFSHQDQKRQRRMGQAGGNTGIGSKLPGRLCSFRG